jgi:hypothetical protein
MCAKEAALTTAPEMGSRMDDPTHSAQVAAQLAASASIKSFYKHETNSP